jgi:hypothetical protein
MRRIVVGIALLLFAAAAFAQRPPSGGERPPFPPDKRPEGRPPMDGPPDRPRCCSKVFDATGKEIGDVLRWDDRFQSVPLQAFVRYRLAGGDDVALLVAPESISGTQQPGGSVALFTTPDCSGSDLFVMLASPPLTKRYAMVLLQGNPSTLMINAAHAWLFATGAHPMRANPGATVFHSQWGDQGACSPYPAPGYTVTGSPVGGYWMKRVEDLYAKFKRPFYSQ